MGTQYYCTYIIVCMTHTVPIFAPVRLVPDPCHHVRTSLCIQGHRGVFAPVSATLHLANNVLQPVHHTGFLVWPLVPLWHWSIQANRSKQYYELRVWSLALAFVYKVSG